jgi:hypothetical protein
LSKREVIYPSNTSQFLRGDATFATAGGGGSQAVSGSNGSFTFDTVTFGNLNGLSFYTSGGSMVGSYTVPVAGAAITVSDAATSGTIGRLAFSNLNGITLSLSTGAGGSHTIVGSYTVPTVTNSSWTVSDSATSGSVARLAFTNLNGVTLSLSSGAGGSHTIVGSHNALTSQSNQALSGSNGSFTFQTATFGNSNGFTFYTTNGSIVGQNAISTARASTDAIGLATAQTNVTWTANSAGLSFNAAGYAGTGTSATNASITLNSNGLAISVAAPGGGAAATYSNFFEPYYLDQNTATCSGSLSQLRLIPMSIPVNLSFGQVNYLASAAVANTGAGNTFQFRLTNVQSIAYSAVYTVQGTNLVDMFMFTRGTGGFSSELETINSTRNSFITNHSLTYRATVNHTAGSTGSVTLNQSQSMMVSYPMMTSGTATSVNPASTVTTWGMGYTTWTSTASTSVTNTYNTTNTASTSVATTHPGTTAWSSWKMAPLGFATSLTPGEYWLGMVRYSSTSSSSTFGSTIATAGTGASYTVTYNASSITRTGGLTFVGQTKSIASSLGWLGFVSANSMAPEQGLGSFSGTWASNTTYLNNAGNPAGAIAFSQILTEVSFCKQWLQMASNRI